MSLLGPGPLAPGPLARLQQLASSPHLTLRQTATETLEDLRSLEASALGTSASTDQ